MEIRLAKTAGFCFGVNRAVELTYNLLNEGHKVATLGPLIHNPQAVADMERRGALVADTVDDIPTGYEVIIRSHGVPRTIYDTLEQRGLVYHDATCPFVKKIQSIAARAEAEGVNQIDTYHITTLIDQTFYLLILCQLTLCGIQNFQIDRNTCRLFFIRRIFRKLCHKFRDKGVILIIQCNSYFYVFYSFLFAAFASSHSNSSKSQNTCQCQILSVHFLFLHLLLSDYLTVGNKILLVSSS